MWKIIQRVLRSLNMNLLYDSGISLLKLYSNEIESENVLFSPPCSFVSILISLDFQSTLLFVN